MANKPINALPTLDELQSDDLLAVWDSSLNTAVKMTGTQMVARLTEIADGHGGISAWNYTPPVAPSLQGTLTLTLADESVITVPITNGAKGDTGNQTYVWIIYSATEPDSDADMSVIPAPWMGIYVGLEATQGNLHYTDYTWYEIKGPKGDGVAYTAQTGTVGLTRTYTMYTADGTAVGTFSVTDGEGAVSTVNGIAPDGNGDVAAVVGSVADLGLTSGNATISAAYAALASKQVLICPATDFAVGELPLFGGNRQTDGSVEIVKGDTDGWIQFHGRQSSVGDYRMFFTSSDVPSGTWLKEWSSAYYGQHGFRGLGIATSTSTVVFSISLPSPSGSAPTINITSAGITGLSGISATVDNQRTDGDAITFDLTGATFTANRAYNCVVYCTLS